MRRSANCHSWFIRLGIRYTTLSQPSHAARSQSTILLSAVPLLQEPFSIRDQLAKRAFSCVAPDASWRHHDCCRKILKSGFKTHSTDTPLCAYVYGNESEDTTAILTKCATAASGLILKKLTFIFLVIPLQRARHLNCKGNILCFVK